MKIRDITTRNIRIPLNDPKKFSTKRVTYRDYTLVNVRTENGIEGWSFVWGLPVVKNFLDMYTDLVIGEPAYATSGIWNKLFSRFDRWDRSGIGMRALSAIDMALWDIIGKAAGMPIYQLMGACREDIEAYYSGGYYPESCKNNNELLAYLEKEMSSTYERGFRAFKMKIGGASPAFDLERVALARKTIGPDSKLMLDANCGYRPEAIITLARKLEEYDIMFLEEPVAVDDLPNCKYVADRINIPVALGENHFGRWQFREIFDHGLGRIVQADPTIMGGFTEYLNLAGVCATYGASLAPHCFHDVAVQMCLCIPEVIIMEYMDAEGDVINVQKILKNPVMAENGRIRAPEGPGHGLILDEEAVAHYLFT